MRERRDAIQGELDRLIGAVASVGHSPALVKAINNREQELSEITRKLFASEPDSVSAHMSRIRQFVYERLGNIRELLYTDVPRAKAELAKHITAIEMAPRSEGKEGHYVAIGEWNLLGELEGNLNDSETERVRMVAGEGFEPSTFGL
jgi:hypothetical protein